MKPMIIVAMASALALGACQSQPAANVTNAAENRADALENQADAIVDNAAPGFLTPFPEAPLPLVAAGNVTAPGQVRSILTFTKLSAAGTMSYYTIMDTDLVVDVTGYFQG